MYGGPRNDTIIMELVIFGEIWISATFSPSQEQGRYQMGPTKRLRGFI